MKRFCRVAWSHGLLCLLVACSTRVWVAESGAAAAPAAAATAGIGAAQGETESGGNGATVLAHCRLGADQGCNDDPQVSSLWGTCQSDGSCLCNAGFAINPRTGKCGLPNTRSCYSPNQNLDAVSEAGAMGCACDARSEADTCRISAAGQNVALTCTGGHWQVAPHGDCAIHECRITRRIAVHSEVSMNPELHAARLGSGFVLSGFDKIANSGLTMANVSWSGVVQEQKFATMLSQGSSLDRVFGVGVLAATPSTLQLIAVDRGGPPPVSSNDRLRATAWQFGSPFAVASQPLFEVFDTALVSKYDVKSSLDGQSTWLIRGNRIIDAEVTAIQIRANAADPVPPFTIPLPSKSWDCLKLIPSPTAATMSVFAQASDGSSDVVWQIHEFDTQSQIVYEASATVPSGERLPSDPCPRLFQKDDTYFAAWPSQTETRVDRFFRMQSKNSPINSLTFPSSGSLVGFGPIANDFLFVHRRADQLVIQRFDASGKETSVFLPDVLDSSNAEIGPELISIEGQALYLSYLTADARVIAEVTCP